MAQPQAPTRPVLGPRCPDALRRLIEGGHGIATIGRNSGASGRAPIEDAAADYWAGVEALAKQTDVDIRHLVPSRSQMATLLRESRDVVNSRERSGKPFKNTFVEVDRPDVGVHILVSFGSGLKLDENLEQPAIRRLKQFVMMRDVCLTWGKRMDRWGRHKFELPTLFTAFDDLRTRCLDGHAAFMGDSEKGLVEVNDMSAFLTLLQANGAHNQASSMPRQTRQGYLNHSDGVMVEGQAKYANGAAPPPGFARVRMKASDGAKGSAMLFIDSPGVLPSDQQAAYGLSMVFQKDDPTKRVDNAALVQFVLRNLGRAGWTGAAVNRYLAAQRFSTPGLQQKFGYTAHYGDGKRPIDKPVSAILERLDVYETGVLVARTGVEGLDDVRISGCFPPGQLKWAEPEDFARLRKWQARNAAMFDRRSPLSFSQLPVDFVDGNTVTSARLAPRPVGKHERYTVGARARAGRHLVCLPPPSTPGLPARGLAWILSESVRDADGAVLAAYVGDQAVPTAAAEEEARLAVEQERLAGLQAQLQAMRASLAETDVTGARVITGQLLSDMQAEYNALSGAAKQLGAELATAVAALGVVQAEARRHTSGAALENLLAMIGSLQDLHDAAWRYEWADVLNLRLAVQDEHTEHGDVTRWDVGGCLLIGTDSVYVLPIEKSVYTGPLIERIAQACHAIDAAREGIPFRANITLTTPQRELLHAMLASNIERRAALSIRDPRILRIVMATVHPPVPYERPFDSATSPAGTVPVVAGPPLSEVELPLVAAELGEDLSLVTAVWRCWTSSGSSATSGREHHLLVESFVAAAQGQRVTIKRDAKAYLFQRSELLRYGWVQRDPETFEAPLCTCGATSWMQTRVVEVDRAICLNCRRDMSGVLWDSYFDRWVSRPDLWAAGLPEIGAELQRAALLAPPMKLAKVQTKASRKHVVLSEAEQQSVAAACLDTGRTYTEIARDFGVSVDTVAHVARRYGVTRRDRFGTPTAAGAAPATESFDNLEESA